MTDNYNDMSIKELTNQLMAVPIEQPKQVEPVKKKSMFSFKKKNPIPTDMLQVNYHRVNNTIECKLEKRFANDYININGKPIKLDTRALSIMKDGKIFKTVLLWDDATNSPISNLDFKEIIARGDYTGNDKFLITRIQGARIDADIKPKAGIPMWVWVLIGVAVLGFIGYMVMGGGK